MALATATREAVKTFDIQIQVTESEYSCSAKPHKLFNTTESVIDVCWDDQGAFLAYVLKDGSVLVTEYASGNQIHRIVEAKASKVAFVKNSSTLLCIIGENVSVFDLHLQKAIAEFECDFPTAIGVMANRLVTGTASGQVFTHSLRDNRTHQLSTSTKQRINSIACNSFKRWVAAAGDDGILCMWDINKGAQPFYESCLVHNGPIVQVQFSCVNKNVYCTVGVDKMLKLHKIDEQSGEHSVVWQVKLDHSATSLALSGEHLIAVGTSQGVFLYDIHWKQSVRHIPGLVSAVSFNPLTRIDSVVVDSENLKLVTMNPVLSNSNSKGNLLNIFSPVSSKTADFRKSKPKAVALTKKDDVMERVKKLLDKSKAPQAHQFGGLVGATSSDAASVVTTKAKAVVIEAAVEAPTLVKAEVLVQASDSSTSPAQTPSTAPVAATAPTGAAAYQYQAIENIVHDSLSNFKMQMRNDLLNIHLDMIKQFHEYKHEMEALIEQHSAVEPLLQEIERLRIENERLKLHY